MKYTGVIKEAYYDRTLGKKALWGLIFDDIHKRFRDGQLIRTSLIKKILPQEDGSFHVRTLNSFYKVYFSDHPDARKEV